MKKHVVTLLLTASMVLSCLAGCGQKEVEEKKTSQSEISQTQESTQQENTQQESAQQKEEEVVTVTWAILCDPKEDDKQVLEEVNKLLRERYNLELNLLSIAEGEYNEKMRLMITSGEDYDLCFTANWSNSFSNNVNQGAFLALNDLLESEAAADLMKVYPKELCDVATVNGNVYALPNYQLIYTQNAVYVQKDLADKYGLDPEKSIRDISELEWFMEKIRDNEPDHYVIRHLGNLEGGVLASDYAYDQFSIAGIDRNDDTYKAVTFVETDYYYQRRKIINEFYKKGFIRSDVATVVDDSAEYKTNKYAMHITTGKPGGDADMSKSLGEEYYMIMIGEPYLAPTAGIGTMTAINVNSKNPEAALKMYSVMWTDKEIFNMLLFGLEGEHYKKVSDNRVEPIADSGYDKSGYAWELGNQFNAWLIPGQDDSVWEETEAINRSATPSHLAGFTLDPTPIESEMAQATSVINEYQWGFIYAEDYDKWYNELTDKLKAAGSDVITAEVQKQIDAWRELNGK